MNVALVPITRHNVRAVCALQVDDAQREYIMDNAASIATAHFRPEAWLRAVSADDRLVGFVMLRDPLLAPHACADFYLWRVMIDHRHQRRGYGRAAVDALIAHVRARAAGPYRRLLVSHMPVATHLGAFYGSFGFAYTGTADEDGELEMSLPLA